MIVACKYGQPVLAIFLGWASVVLCAPAVAQPLPDPDRPESSAPTTVAPTNASPVPWRWQISAQAHMEGTHAPLSPTAWANQPLSPTPQTNAWHWQMRAGMAGPWGASTQWSWSINTLQQGQLLADGNALRLAALDKLGEKTTSTTDGSYPLQAQSWRLQANTLGSTWSGALHETVRIQVVSELAQIKTFFHDQVDLQWVQSGARGSLQGSLRQTGTKRYGFLSEEAPDAGQGYWLHTRLQWTGDTGHVSAQIDNLWNRLDFDNIHFAQTNYQMQITDGELALGKIPSISGTYGMHSTHLSLPRVWQWSAQMHLWPRWEVGQKGVAQIGRVYMAYKQPVACGQIRLETVQLKNWTVGVRCAFLHRQLWLGAGLSTDVRFAHPLASHVQLQWMW